MTKDYFLNSIHTNHDMENFNTRRHNTPIAKLIRDFTNKDSGKVCESRKDIQIRFDYLDWKDQKKILSAFLESGKTDRQWAYSKLVYYWDKSFEHRVKELWEKHHEYRCSWPVIRYFPEKYILQHMEEFTVEKDYYYICLRLTGKNGFHIEKDKLTPADYLSVLYQSGGTISEEEAKDILFSIVHRYCVEGNDIPKRVLDSSAYTSLGRIIFSPMMFKDATRAHNYLRELNWRAAYWFEKWDEDVQTAISGSPEYKAVIEDLSDPYRSIVKRIRIAYKYSYLALDEKYKQPSDPDFKSILLPQKGNEEELSCESVKSIMSELDKSGIAFNLYDPDTPPF